MRHNSAQTIKTLADYGDVKMTIYVASFPNGKMYVGQTKQALKQRWYFHKSSAFNERENRDCCRTAFARALRKYGSENCELRVLSVCKDQNELNLCEKFWIKKLDTISPSGYNLTTGGDNSNLSEETKRKISESLRRRTVSYETREKIGNAHRGKTISLESKEKMSQAKIGKKQSKEQIEKRVRKLKGRKRSIQECEAISLGKMKKVVCNSEGSVFQSVREAAAFFKKSESWVSGICNGKIKSKDGFGLSFLGKENETSTLSIQGNASGKGGLTP